jgi:hypothetical protein
MYNDLQDALEYRTDQNAPFNTTVTLRNIPLSQLPLIPGQPVNGGLVAPNGVQQDMYTPTILSYNLRIEQELTPNTVFAVSYVGSHGYHETLSADLIQAVPIICPASPCPANLAPGTIYHPAASRWRIRSLAAAGPGFQAPTPRTTRYRWTFGSAFRMASTSGPSIHGPSRWTMAIRLTPAARTTRLDWPKMRAICGWTGDDQPSM